MRRGDVAVALAAIAFGVTIPLGKLTLDASEPAAPFAFVSLRFLLGGVVLGAGLAVARRSSLRAGPGLPVRTVRTALGCALPLGAGYVALTVGLDRTTSTTAAFLSYLLVVIVPVLMATVYRRLPSPAVAAGIVLSVAGLERLTGGEGRFGLGEALCLLAALLFATHVIVLGRAVASPDTDPLALTAMQLLAVGAATLPVAAAVDGFDQPFRWWWLMALVGLIGVAALALQTLGQRSVAPSRTALILMIDPVVAAVGGYLLGERIGWRGVLGAGLILAGIATAELLDRHVPDRRT